MADSDLTLRANQGAVYAQLKSLLRVEGLSRKYIKYFPNPDPELVKAFLKSNHNFG